MKYSFTLVLSVLVFTSIFFAACKNDEAYTPKPMGYFRIDFPEKEYQSFDSASFPYQFEYPVYADIVHENSVGSKDFWLNINYPNYLGQVSLTYLPVYNSIDTLYKYTEDSYNFVSKHIPMANDITPDIIQDTLNKIYGLKYDIAGSSTASPYQFFITDSCNHFLRASLHFYVLPNNDSLSPVINFIKEDLEHMIETMKWK